MCILENATASPLLLFFRANTLKQANVSIITLFMMLMVMLEGNVTDSADSTESYGLTTPKLLVHFSQSLHHSECHIE